MCQIAPRLKSMLARTCKEDVRTRAASFLATLMHHKAHAALAEDLKVLGPIMDVIETDDGSSSSSSGGGDGSANDAARSSTAHTEGGQPVKLVVVSVTNVGWSHGQRLRPLCEGEFGWVSEETSTQLNRQPD